MAQTQVDVGPDALHGLDGQGAPQVLGVGPGRGQAETEAGGGEDGGRPEWLRRSRPGQPKAPPNTPPRSRGAAVLPVHGVGLVPAVGDVFKQAAHAGVLGALLRRAEVVVRHLVHDVVRDAPSPV